MKLSDYIENKKQELLTEGYRSVELKGLHKCQVSRNLTSMIFDIGYFNKIDTSIEVEDFNRSELGDNKIDAIDISFNVVKPRCRKPVNHTVYVKVS